LVQQAPLPWQLERAEVASLAPANCQRWEEQPAQLPWARMFSWCGTFHGRTVLAGARDLLDQR